MAYEVEIKAHISAEEYTRLKKELAAKMKDEGFDEKHDSYFKKIDEREETLRLRSCESKGAVLTYKERHMDEAVEANREIEICVSDKEAAQQLLEAIGYRLTFEKSKMVHLFSDQTIKYELAEVAGLGLFIEIEKVIEDESDHQAIERAKEDVKRALMALGVQEEQIERQSYKKLLGFL